MPGYRCSYAVRTISRWVLGSDPQGTGALKPSGLPAGEFFFLVPRYESFHAVRWVPGPGASHKGSNVREQVGTGF